MELYIQIKNGEPFEHPILGENFRQAFPHIDTTNLPPEFARFELVPCPPLVYATLNSREPTYAWVEGVIKNVWDVTPLTPDQIKQKQDSVKADWAENGFASWNFNEDTCSFDPPTPYPTDGNRYRWDEPTLSWIEIFIS